MTFQSSNLFESRMVRTRYDFGNFDVHQAIINEKEKLHTKTHHETLMTIIIPNIHTFETS